VNYTNNQVKPQGILGKSEFASNATSDILRLFGEKWNIQEF
jgi:hypothetical protein